MSFTIDCETHAEIDRTWDALLEGGGHPKACGWQRDRLGVDWQIHAAGDVGDDGPPYRRRAKQAVDAMMTLVNFDLAKLQAASDA